MSFRERVVRSISWSALGQFLNDGLMVLVTAVFARLLGPDPFGPLALFLIIVGYANILTDLGISASLVHKKDLHPEDISSALWMTLGVGALLTLVTLGAAEWLAELYGMPSLKELTRLSALVIAVTALSLVQRALASRNLQFKKLAIIDSSGTLVGAVVGITMAVWGYGAVSLAWLFVSRAAWKTLALWWLSVTPVLGPLKMERLRGLAGFSGYVAVSQGFGYASENVDRALLAGSVPEGELALYDQGMRIMLMPIRAVVVVVSRVLFPALSRIQDDPVRLAAAWLRGLSMTSLLVFPCTLGLVAVATPLAETLFGSTWLGIVPYIQVLSILGLAAPVNGLVTGVLFATGHAALELRVNFTRRAIIIVLVIAALPFGALTVAWARVVGGFVSNAINLWSVRQCLEVPVGHIVRAMAPNLVLSIGMCGVVWALCEALGGLLPPAVVLVIGVVVGALIYGALGLGLKNPSMAEALEVVRSRG